MFRFGLSKDKKTFTASKFEGFKDEQTPKKPGDDSKIAIVLDVETTGLDRTNDEIIEIAARKIAFNSKDGSIVQIGEVFSGMQEPSRPLPEEITKLTGIKQSDLKGKKIDWRAFDDFIKDAVLVIAHNASFDRPFIERYSKLSKDLIWGCSASQIPWTEWFPSAKQEFLALSHGFFYEAHRSLMDVDALIKLLGTEAPEDTAAAYYFSHLLNNARKRYFKLSARNAPFETKDILKKRRYRWQNDERVWSKRVSEDQLESEKEFLEHNVYGSKGFLGEVLPIAPKDNFK